MDFSGYVFYSADWAYLGGLFVLMIVSKAAGQESRALLALIAATIAIGPSGVAVVPYFIAVIVLMLKVFDILKG